MYGTYLRNFLHDISKAPTKNLDEYVVYANDQAAPSSRPAKYPTVAPTTKVSAPTNICSRLKAEILSHVVVFLMTQKPPSVGQGDSLSKAVSGSESKGPTSAGAIAFNTGAAVFIGVVASLSFDSCALVFASS